MAVGSEQMGKAGCSAAAAGGESVEGILGSGLMPAVFGRPASSTCASTAPRRSTSPRSSVKNHKHSAKNPLSQYQVEVALEDVMKARMVAYPNTLYMCCPTGDGAAAAIVWLGRRC